MVVVRTDDDPLIRERALAAENSADVVRDDRAAVSVDGEINLRVVLAQRGRRWRILGRAVGARAQRNKIASLCIGDFHDRIDRRGINEETRHADFTTEAVCTHRAKISLFSRVSRRFGHDDAVGSTLDQRLDL
ncbi:MAG: hypothetical protein DWI12_04850 [Planctomycetota bacterium]|nr:MAG: hypothetical protein DWI12_04850 [Planctomycetota bacterium]